MLSALYNYSKFALLQKKKENPKNAVTGKRVIKKWRVDRLDIEDVNLNYQEALQVEVLKFSEDIRQKRQMGL